MGADEVVRFDPADEVGELGGGVVVDGAPSSESRPRAVSLRRSGRFSPSSRHRFASGVLDVVVGVRDGLPVGVEHAGDCFFSVVEPVA